MLVRKVIFEAYFEGCRGFSRKTTLVLSAVYNGGPAGFSNISKDGVVNGRTRLRPQGPDHKGSAPSVIPS